MLKEKVIITKLPITQAGQIQHFQVKIPRDAERIIGMEASARYLDIQAAQQTRIIGINTFIRNPSVSLAQIAKQANIFQIVADPFLGDVRLQTCEDTNVFYAEDIYFTDKNLAFGDFSINPQFIPLPETHGYKREECVVNTSGETTILKGIYRDRQKTASAQFNTAGQGFFPYEATIYVWYELKIIKA